MTRTTDGKPTAQLDLFDDIMRDDMNSNTNISEKTTSETNSLMKDSGVEWIGEIPTNWKIVPHKYFMRKIKQICEHWSGEAILSLTVNGVIVRDIENGKGKFPATFDGYQFIKSGNLILCLFDLDVTPCCAGLAKQNGITSPAYSQFEMLNGANAQFYLYYLHIMLDKKKYYLHLSSNLRSTLTAEAFGRIKAAFPPLAEQVAIASRLDSITSRIDESVRLIDEQLADLKDYRKALISEVVTRGVPSDSTPQPTKPTNTKWIPTIPTHWKTQRLKAFLISSNGGEVIDKRWWNNGNELLYTCQITPMQSSFTDFPVWKRTTETDILVTRNATPYVFLPPANAIYSNVVQRIQFDNRHMNRKYLAYVLQQGADAYGRASGISIPSYNMDIWKNIDIPVPPIDEQVSIVNYLDQRLSALSRHEETLSQQRDDLLVYRQSVISEYVTGKRRV